MGSIGTQMVKASAVVVVALVLGNLISFLKTAIVAASLGTGQQLDLFLWAYALVTLFATFLGAPLTATLVPVFLSIKATGEEPARKLVSSVLGWSFLVFVCLCILLAVWVPEMTRTLLAGLSPENMVLATGLVWLMLPVVGLSGVSAASQALLNAEKSFFVSSISPYFPTIFVVAAVLIADQAQVAIAMAIGYSVGAVVQVTILLFLLRRKGLGKRWTINLHTEGLTRILRLLGPLVATSALLLTLPLIDRTIAARFQQGAISSLGYAQMLMTGTVAVFLTAVHTAALPYFSDQLARDGLAAFRITFHQTIRLLVVVLVPANVVVIVLAQPIIRLAFERGAFDATATNLTEPAFIAYLVGMMPLALTFICSRGFNALQDSKTNALVGVFFLFLVKVVLNVVFTSIWGYLGLAVATSAAYVVTGFAMLLLMRSRLGGLDGKRLAATTLKALVGSAAAGFLAWLGAARFLDNPAAQVTLGLILAVLGYVFASYILHLDEMLSLGSAGLTALRYQWTRIKQRLVP